MNKLKELWDGLTCKRLIIVILVIAALFILSGPLMAHGSASDTVVDSNNVTNNYYDSTAIESSSSGGGSNGYSTGDQDRAYAAMLSAGACQFDWSKGIQGCVGAGYWEDASAVTFQVGKRVDDLLLNGGVACDTDFNTCGYTGAVNFHF